MFKLRWNLAALNPGVGCTAKGIVHVCNLGLLTLTVKHSAARQFLPCTATCITLVGPCHEMRVPYQQPIAVTFRLCVSSRRSKASIADGLATATLQRP